MYTTFSRKNISHFLKYFFNGFQPWFQRLMQIEDGLTEKGIFQQRIRKMFKQSLFPNSGVEDDHKPFERQGLYFKF